MKSRFFHTSKILSVNSQPLAASPPLTHDLRMGMIFTQLLNAQYNWIPGLQEWHVILSSYRIVFRMDASQMWLVTFSTSPDIGAEIWWSYVHEAMGCREHLTIADNAATAVVTPLKNVIATHLYTDGCFVRGSAGTDCGNIDNTFIYRSQRETCRRANNGLNSKKCIEFQFVQVNSILNWIGIEIGRAYIPTRSNQQFRIIVLGMSW